MNDDRRQDSKEQLAAPARLTTALRELHAGRVTVPPSVDEAILRAGREQLRAAAARESRPGVAAALVAMARAVRRWTEACQLNWRKPAPWAAAAAALVLAALLGRMALEPRAPAMAEDLNRDGQVDMLDAFTLALQVQHGASPGPRLDLNGDGMVDERDAEVLAARAVALEKARKS